MRFPIPETSQELFLHGVCTSFLALRFESHVRWTCFLLNLIVWLTILIALWYCDLYEIEISRITVKEFLSW